ncbi:succinate dehydrogenase, cytochrome b556 subunit [Paracoccus sp. P2]|uniref:Succinate dehydrogenase cytochrome b556 subunit n=1 Tax=Paracoccus pantotrophus TaxID=82367 RepID=A0A1I5EG96_PARPN|nr:succinate dehydrogenase, cytochrome b556 subunit [Paracoccus pantotrophus]MDF3853118.1 succinate dehydrogenase, cytochrome b556 subunit [Paracoccus pantotrophus]QFG36974.1 succinate dehydrogenase, cytochrome b556 subunit [Paracoccus pantotrophus]QLH14541.1 succinate dehydrogenase, cytochrome b556 subunit [Paracoccus pantotrophus]RDD98487.1 succinate dehydrogenase, cytochrome b556 subunit [Paracoccus pantotrophus]RKS52613.1 succinate dehydrogenase subunit C [Paracoccus pantotrophus]
MADVNRGNRPLSPHLQVYRLPLAAITSIMTRITGHALVAGIVLITWWLVAAVTSPGAFAVADWVVRSWLGFIILTGSMWALWYHLLAGLRHLAYDAGYGLEIEEARKSSQALIAGSVVLAVLTLIVFFVF